MADDLAGATDPAGIARATAGACCRWAENRGQCCRRSRPVTRCRDL